VKDTQLPIYFHSPGGMVEQAFVIGRLLVKLLASCPAPNSVKPVIASPSPASAPAQ
jgi:hypothetical protein